MIKGVLSREKIASDQRLRRLSYECLVGSQPMAEFMAAFPAGTTAKEAARRYVEESPICANLSEEDKTDAIKILAWELGQEGF